MEENQKTPRNIDAELLSLADENKWLRDSVFYLIKEVQRLEEANVVDELPTAMTPRERSLLEELSYTRIQLDRVQKSYQDLLDKTIVIQSSNKPTSVRLEFGKPRLQQLEPEEDRHPNHEPLADEECLGGTD